MNANEMISRIGDLLVDDRTTEEQCKKLEEALKNVKLNKLDGIEELILEIEKEVGIERTNVEVEKNEKFDKLKKAIVKTAVAAVAGAVTGLVVRKVLFKNNDTVPLLSTKEELDKGEILSDYVITGTMHEQIVEELKNNVKVDTQNDI